MTNKAEENTLPKMFISYRWSSPQHEQWVLDLATSFRSDGIDVILDKWHLKEGNDTFVFMERMVNDRSVTKVLLICDAGYVERADQRQGGVGTEAQIVSSEVYSKVDQTKFAAAVREIDEDGSPLLPRYLANRLYFDFSSEESFASNYEKVLRWCFDKPFHPVPPIGKPPKYLDETFQGNSNLLKGASALRAVQSRGGDPKKAASAVLSGIAEDAKNLCLSLADVSDSDQNIVDTIEQSTPLREQAITAINAIIENDEGSSSADAIHRFLEDLFGLWDYGRPDNGRYSVIDNDALKFFAHSTFVATIACCMKQRKFAFANSVLSTPFFKPSSNEYTGKLENYTSLRTYLKSLEEIRKRRLSLNRLSVHADMIKDTFNHSIVSLGDFMEADFTLYLRGMMESDTGASDWFPVSLVYASDSYGAFPTYVRATSKSFFSRLSPLLGDASAEQIRSTIRDGKGRIRFGGWADPDVWQLANAEALATRG